MRKRASGLAAFVIFMLVVIVFTTSTGSANRLRAVSDRVDVQSGLDGTGVVIFSQNNDCSGNGPASQLFPDFADAMLQSADDFVIPVGDEWIIDAVVVSGTFFNANPDSGPIDGVLVQFWTDNAGLPGTMICEELGFNNAPEPEMRIDLAGACLAAFPLTEGTYWVSMAAIMEFAPSGQWAWNANDSTNGAEFAVQDPAGLLGGPCVSWGSGLATCGIGATFPDLCFAFEGAVVPVELTSFSVE